MFFRPIQIGSRRNVTYIIADEATREAAVVDAGDHADELLPAIYAFEFAYKYVIATHTHRDHVAAAGALIENTGAQFAVYKEPFKPTPAVDVPLDDGDILWVGSIPIEVLHTPGHTLDCICLLVDNSKLLTGDMMYVGRVPGASHCNKRQAQGFYDSVHRLLALADDVEVWPGHNNGKTPSSTIGRERRENVCAQMTFEEFSKLRRYDRKLRRWVLP